MSGGILKSYLHFFRAGLLKHAQTGGLLPSQAFLVEKMLEPVPPDYGGQVIELGAGSGVLTRRLAVKCRHARILACEINPTLAHDARRHLAQAKLSERVEVIASDAENLLSKRIQAGFQKPDYIISGLPLGNLRRHRASVFIDLIGRALAETGLYIQFQHSLLDRKRIRARFATLRTALVFLNFPPAFVYYAQGPLAPR